jgi:outer membrane protein
VQFIVLLALPAVLAAAEIRTMTLGEAVRLALGQNPDVILARLDEQKAAQAVHVARDPFIPKLAVGIRENRTTQPRTRNSH